MNPKHESEKDEIRFGVSSFSLIIIFVCLSVIGFCLLPLLNIQLNPTSESLGFSVSYYWRNASARVVEQEVTAKLEGLFSAVKGIQDISSVSSAGYGRISLGFKKGVNMDAMRFEIANLIRHSYSELPAQVSYPDLSSNYSNHEEGPLLSYTLNANASPYYIQKYAERNIVPKLNRIRGINATNVYGASPYEWEIEFKVNVLKDLGLGAHDIIDGLTGFFKKDFVGKGHYKLPLSTYTNETTLVFQCNSGDSLVWESIPIKKTGDRIIYLREVAKVRYKEQVPNSYFRINGLNTINIVLYPEKGINTIALAKTIRHSVSEIQKGLPVGYSMILANDTTEFLSKELSKISLRSIFSLSILLVFLLIFSRKFNYVLLILISLAVTLAIASTFYYLLKIELHWYSLAGITISYGFMVDNSIVMADHFRKTGNKKVFLAMLGAVLTTIGALGIVFLLKEEQKVDLVDFALVITINLVVSLSVSLFFIPVLMDKFKLGKKKNRLSLKRKQRIVRGGRFYGRFILFNKRWKWAYIILFILAFGIPVQWLPVQIEGESKGAEIYNETLGNKSFQEHIRPPLEKIVGGALRLFTRDVFENASYSEPSRTTLYVNAKMPEGCTTFQLNETMQQMENVVSQFDEVELFETAVYSYANARMTINFKPEFEKGSFPYFLKQKLESQAINFGGADWSVYGVGQGFSNEIHVGMKDSQIILEGYNYEQLYTYAEFLKQKLVDNPRVKGLEIAGKAGWGDKVDYEYYMDFAPKQMAANKLSPNDFYSYLKDKTHRTNLNPVYQHLEMQPVMLTSDVYEKFNVWDFANEPITINGGLFKISQFGKIEKRKSGNDIYKWNQQYRLVVAYNFIGDYQLSNLVMERHVEAMTAFLPIGYKVFKSQQWRWDKEDKSQYYLIFLVMVIIYFICAMLFESLLQPLAIIGIIPISFIGVFLTFYLFDINFDQGGFASFILLCGVVVNAGLYIINDYNNFYKASKNKPQLTTYIKAFNYKIIPILLTLLSSILGLLPFIYAGQNEVFWFAFAAGTIGGLIFSLIGIVIYLPIFLKFNPSSKL